MRRSIIQKKANSLIFSDKQTESKDLEDPYKPRPQTSCQKAELPEIPFIQTDNSNTSFKNYKKSQLLYLETLGNFKDDFTLSQKPQRYTKTCKKVISSSLYFTETSTKRHKSKNLNFFIKGRPLTAHAQYPEAQKPSKPSPKKRSSVFSYGESDLVTPLEPKFFDEEYTNIEEYTKLLINPPTKTSVGVYANQTSVQDKSVIGEKEVRCFSFSPQMTGKTRNVRKKVGLLVTTPYAPIYKTPTYTRKGKILKGLCNRPIIVKKSKLIHNIQVS